MAECVKSLPLRPADHSHQLSDLLALVRLVAAGDRVLDAMGDVVLQDLSSTRRNAARTAEICVTMSMQ